MNEVQKYIDEFDGDTKDKLVLLRKIIIETIPNVKEKISWGMPTFYIDRSLIHFAMHKKHIGIYPGPDAIVNLSEELKSYKTSKGAIQIPIDKPLPVKLIKDVLKEVIKVNLI